VKDTFEDATRTASRTSSASVRPEAAWLELAKNGELPMSAHLEVCSQLTQLVLEGVDVDGHEGTTATGEND
jgi:hypothetical protein